MRSNVVVCTASADVLASLVDAVQKRVRGPKDSSVRHRLHARGARGRLPPPDTQARDGLPPSPPTRRPVRSGAAGAAAAAVAAVAAAAAASPHSVAATNGCQRRGRRVGRAGEVAASGPADDRWRRCRGARRPPPLDGAGQGGGCRGGRTCHARCGCRVLLPDVLCGLLSAQTNTV